MTSLTRSALAGVVWNWAGSAMLIVAQIASTAVTARLIAPKEFGAYASAQALIGLAGYFTMGSIANGLLRRSTLEPVAVGTAITLSVGAGAMTALAVWFLATPWAHAWGIPGAAGLIHVLAVNMLVVSAAIVPVVLIRHQLRFGLVAALEVGTQVLGLAASVALAVALHSAVALAIGQVAGSACLLLMAGGIARRRLRPAFDRSEARELLAFSSQVSALGFGTYAVNTVPSWFAARTYGSAVLGLYSRANLIVGLPHTYFVTGVMKILYPLYGRVRDDLARTRTLLDEGLTLSTGLIWPLYAMLAGAAPVVVRVLLGQRWHAAAPLVALCALIACGDFPCSLLTNAAEALGWMRAIALRQVVFLAGVGASIAVVYLADLDLEWLLAGIALAQWVAYAMTLTPFVERGLLGIRSTLQAQVLHGAAALVVFGITFAGARVVEGTAAPVQVLCMCVVGFGVCGALFALRSRLPAGRVLERRFAHIAPTTTRWRLLGLGTAAR